MAAKYDIEKFCSDLEAKLKPALLAKINEINLEKSDGVVLDPIRDDAWIFQSLDDRAKNFKDFIVYYISDLTGEINGPHYAQNVTIEIDLLIQDRQDRKIEQRILRYMRAMTEALANMWGTLAVGIDNPTIKSLAPIDIQLNNSSYYHKVFGVSVSFTLVN